MMVVEALMIVLMGYLGSEVPPQSQSLHEKEVIKYVSSGVNGIGFKSTASQYSISGTYSPYFLPAIQESENRPQSISGWKKVAAVTTEFTSSVILNFPVAFYFNLGIAVHHVPPEEAKSGLWYYVGISSLISSTSVWGVGYIFGDRRSYLKALVGGVVGGITGKILVDRLHPDYSANAFNLIIFSPLGATIGYNL